MKNFKFTWGTAMVLALLCFMIMIVSLIVFYPKGSHNTFDLVNEDYYNEGMKFQDELNARNNAKTLDSLPKITIEADKIVVQFHDYQAVDNGNVLLYRPSDKQLDRQFDLKLNAYKQFVIADSSLTEGKYKLKVKWEKNKTPYLVEQEILWK